MVKAADALAEAGHAVRIVSSQFLDWAAEADTAIGFPGWRSVDYRRGTAPVKYFETGLRFHAARKWVRLMGAEFASLATLAAATARASRDLLRLALAEPADLYYGGSRGGLAVAALAARRTGVPYGLDLEDFHDGEFETGPAWDRSRAFVRSLQREVLPGAAFITAGSSAIAAHYRHAYGVPVLPIHNTFPLPARAPDPEPQGTDALRLYWFSQTIGTGRGLEDAVRAVGKAGIRAELHLRGAAQPEYIASLRGLARASGAQLAVRVHPPAPPTQMVELSIPYDVGLSGEEPLNANKELCLGNKPLTYILAGLAVVLTDTLGHRSFAADLGDGALRYRSGDIAALAAGLRRWASDRGHLRRARQAAWQAAQRRWHWQHRCEKGALIEAVQRTVHAAAMGAAR
jgi:glycosyltransferase involved in cell wall biosynthesis